MELKLVRLYAYTTQCYIVHDVAPARWVILSWLFKASDFEGSLIGVNVPQFRLTVCN